MRALFIVLLSLQTLYCLQSELKAEEKTSISAQIRSAINRAIPLIEKASAGSAEQRKCFTCHSQAVPVLAFTEAQRRGFSIDEENLARQLQHTADHLKRGIKNYQKGKGQGGQVITAGYALWTLDAGNKQPDKTTAAVAHYLLENQKDKDHWFRSSKRPPSSGSPFMITYVALRGLDYFGTEEQQEKINQRKAKVSKWLNSAEPKDSEDRVFQLQAFQYTNTDKKTQRKAVADLIDQQREDGGWAQKSEMESDAYATGTVLTALLETGTSPTNPAVKQGIQYLLDTQQDDGSWHVVTRAEGFQEYFETGFPHDEDQYISTAASSWAVLALLLTLPEPTISEE
ncbi:MAG: prenyltransferase/squalene oxidase repeat-containing protein [Pirellulales bacterium]